MENNQTPILSSQQLPSYNDNSMEQAGQIAEEIIKKTVFSRYHQTKSTGTKSAQKNDLELFSTYLRCIGVDRHAESLFFDADAWKGMNASLLEGFRQWLYYGQEDNKGYKVSSVNRCLSTIRQYCRMAFQSGVIPHENWLYIKEIKSNSYAEAFNIDSDRESKGIVPRKGFKKAESTFLDEDDFTALQKTKTNHLLYREHDCILDQRDDLLLCLLGEHGLRVSEVVGLNVENIDLRKGKITVTRYKTHTKDTLDILPYTQQSAALYLPLISSQLTSPLFIGYREKRITRRGITIRIQKIGELIGIQNLSPHDLRHYFTRIWFARGEQLNIIQRYGGWNSGTMPLHYARLFGIDENKPKILQKKESDPHV